MTDFTLPNGVEIKCLDEIEATYFYNDIVTLDSHGLKTLSLPEHPVILDIGANIGLFSLFVHSLFPRAQIHAIEPVRPLYDLLSLNLGRYVGGFKSHNIGLGEKSGSRPITYYEDISGMSTFYPDETYEQALLSEILKQQFDQDGAVKRNQRNMADALAKKRFNGTQMTAQIKTLTALVVAEKITKIDLLKIDAQKSELDILRGANAEVWDMTDRVIVETHDINGSAKAIIALLKDKQFEVTLGHHPLHRSSTVRLINATRT